METDPEPVHGDMQGDTWDAQRDPPVAPMKTDPEPTHVGTQGAHGTPGPPRWAPWKWTSPRQVGRRSRSRSRPRTTASTHTSRDLVLPNAAVRTPRRGLTNGVGLPAVSCVSLALGNTAPPSSPLAGTLPAGLDLVHLLGTRIPPLRKVGPGLLHVRPGAHLPAVGPGTGADMGDPGSSSPISPHHPRSPRRNWQCNEVHMDPAVSAQLPGCGYGPVGSTDRPHTTAGCNGRPPDARPEQVRGNGGGCRLAPRLGPDSSGRPGSPRRRGAGTCPPSPDVRRGL